MKTLLISFGFLFSLTTAAEVVYDGYYSIGQPVSCGGKGGVQRPAQPPIIDVPAGARGPVQALGLRSLSASLDEEEATLDLSIGMSMSSCVKDKASGEKYWFSEPADSEDYLLLVVYHGTFSDERFRQNYLAVDHVNMDTGNVRTISTARFNVSLKSFLSSDILKSYEKGETVTVKMTAHYGFKNFESSSRAYFPYDNTPISFKPGVFSRRLYEEDLSNTYLYGAAHGLSITFKKGVGVLGFERKAL